MIVDSAVYRDGVRLGVDCSFQDLETMRAKADKPGDFVWVGVHDATEEEMERLGRTFHLHPLAIEDALSAHSRPKLERFGESLFLVLKTLWYIDAEDAVETGEINLFVGGDYVISVRHGEGAELHTARVNLESQTRILGHGPASVLYAVVDRVVDDYEEVIASLEVDVDEVERSVFSTDRTDDANRIYTLKREIAEVRRAVFPLVEPMRRFATGSVDGVGHDSAPFFRDVLDHLRRAADQLDGLDSLLSTAFDAHLARISVQQNDDMRKISAGAALVVVPTLIAGVYGMNFDRMPELHWRFGYAWALGLMVGTAGLLWWLFKRSGWL